MAITFAEPREHRLLRSIESMTKQKIAVAPLPTVHDIKAKRLEITRADIRETIQAGGLDKYRVVVETLAEEFDIMDIAAAAVQLAHQAEAGEEPVEIPPAPEPAKRERPAKSEKYVKHGEKSERPSKKPAGRGPKMARVFIGSGKSSNMRPADLVGAIANEAGIEAKSIGTIEICGEVLAGGAAGGTGGRRDQGAAQHHHQGQAADRPPRRGEPPRLLAPPGRFRRVSGAAPSAPVPSLQRLARGISVDGERAGQRCLWSHPHSTR